MKLTIKFLAHLFIASFFLLSSCSKEGEVGPMGPRGEQGLQGPQGPEGPAGQTVETQEGTDGESQAGGVVDGEQGQQGETGMQGERGAQGIQGEQGPQGEAGEDGNDGQDGEDGNANVIDSGWIPADFISGRMRVEDQNLTFDVVNRSVIMVFGIWSDGEEYIFQFPHQIAEEKFSYNLLNEAVGTSFAINFIVQGEDGFPIEEVSRCDAVKYFIIPANTLTGKNSSDSLTKMSYQQLMNHFNLDF